MMAYISFQPIKSQLSLTVFVNIVDNEEIFNKKTQLSDVCDLRVD